MSLFNKRSKVAIPSKKRKEISSSDSDDDVELDVSTSKRAKKSGRKVPGNVPDAPLDNSIFFTQLFFSLDNLHIMDLVNMLKCSFTRSSKCTVN